MTQSTYPTLPPSPIGIGDLLGSALKLFAKHWKLYVLLAMIPPLVSTVVTVIAVAVGVGAGIFVAGAVPQIAPVLVGIGVALAVIFAIQAMVTLYCSSVAIGLAEGSAWGEARTWSDARGRVRGVLTRFGWVQILLALLATLFVVGWVAALLVPLIRLIETGSEPSDAQVSAFIGGLALFIVISLLMIPAVLIWQAKFAFVIPIAALEHDKTGFGVYGHSWRMTKGHFWRILGYTLLAGLIVSVLVSAVNQVTSAIYSPLTSIFNTETGAYNGISSVAWLALGLTQLLSTGLSAVAGMVMTLFVFVLYIDTDRRNRGEVVSPFTAPYGAPYPGPYGQPGPYQQQPGPYHQPGQPPQW